MPDSLATWAHRQLALLGRDYGAVPSLMPLIVGLGNRCLVARLAAHQPGQNQYVALLEERILALAPEDAMTIGLTRREAEVLALVAQGKADREIADLLVISARTVQKHLEHIFLKLGVATRAAAVAKAFQAIRRDVEPAAETIRYENGSLIAGGATWQGASSPTARRLRAEPRH